MDEDVKAAIAAHREKRAELQREVAERRMQARAEWRQSAQAAWDGGGAFYQPVIIEVLGRSGEALDAAATCDALEAVTSVGWNLSGWQASTTERRGFMMQIAQPLFTR